jgi:glycosyltransferase involved in cell wall biosynthesis
MDKKNQKVLYVSFLPNYFSGLTQRTHHIINHMDKNEEISQIDIIHIDNHAAPPDYVTVTYQGKKRFYGISTAPSFGGGWNHLSAPVHMYERFNKVCDSTYDYIIAETPWGGMVGSLLKNEAKRSNILIYEDMDYFPGFYTKCQFRHNAMKLLEQGVLRDVDLVITIGEKLKRERERVTEKEVLVYHNGVNFKSFTKAHQKEQGAPTLLYMGAIEEWAGVDLPVYALPHLIERFPNIKYVVVGSGPYLEELEELTCRLSVREHVEFKGLHPYSALPDFLKKADIGIAVYRPIDLMKYAFTLKVVEYGAAGLPVIATAIGETEEYVNKNRSGVLIEHNVQQFISAVVKLLEDRQLYEECCQNGIAAASHMDWETILEERHNAIQAFLSKQ